jgi:hypothetical protein
MAGWRRPIELAVNHVEVAALEEISRSRSEPAIRVERERILLAYRESLSFFAVRRAVGVHHQTVQRCMERAAVEGPMAALDQRPRPGKTPTIGAQAKAWIKDLASRKAKELGYPHELWTTRFLASHAREHGPAEGRGCLAKLAQGTLCKILNEQEIKPHKVHYYLERREPEFKQKRLRFLCLSRGRAHQGDRGGRQTGAERCRSSDDENKGIQTIANTAPELPPKLAAPPARGDLQTTLRTWRLAAGSIRSPASPHGLGYRRLNAGFQRSKLFCGAERFRRVFPRRIPLFAPHNTGTSLHRADLRRR